MGKLEVPEDVRLTIESGLLCCSFSEFHGWAEKLMGHPIWTHEFGSLDTWLDLNIALIANDNETAYHPRRRSPLETLMETAPNKLIIAVIKS